MLSILAVAIAHQPIELSILPIYRSSQIENSLSNFGDTQYGVRMRVVARLRPWASFQLDTTQSILDSRWRLRRRAQRSSRLRFTAGPRWDPMNIRLRVGVGQEGVLEVSPTELQIYHPMDVVEIGAEATLQGPLARLTLGATTFSPIRGAPSRSIDAELTIPNESLWAATLTYDARKTLGGRTPTDQPTPQRESARILSMGITIRPKVRRSAADEAGEHVDPGADTLRRGRGETHPDMGWIGPE